MEDYSIGFLECRANRRTVDSVWRRLAQARPSSNSRHITMRNGTINEPTTSCCSPPRRTKRTRVLPPIRCKERLGGLLRYYHRHTA
jgi:hypothetical protein